MFEIQRERRHTNRGSQRGDDRYRRVLVTHRWFNRPRNRERYLDVIFRWFIRRALRRVLSERDEFDHFRKEFETFRPKHNCEVLFVTTCDDVGVGLFGSERRGVRILRDMCCFLGYGYDVLREREFVCPKYDE